MGGDHVPEGATGLNSAAFDPDIAANSLQTAPQQPAAPVQQAVQAPRQRVAQVARQQVRPASTFAQQPQRAPLPTQNSASFNPFINPADPSHLDFQVNTNAAQFNGGQVQARQQVLPQARQQVPLQARQQVLPQVSQQVQQTQPQFQIPSANSVPACADCQGFNPFVNPADFSHQQQQFPQQQAGFRSSGQQFPINQFSVQPQQNLQQVGASRSNSVVPAFLQQPSQPAVNFQQRQFRQPQQFQPTQTIPVQNQQFSSPQTNPGQLSLNRFQNGFNFDFSAQ